MKSAAAPSALTMAAAQAKEAQLQAQVDAMVAELADSRKANTANQVALEQQAKRDAEAEVSLRFQNLVVCSDRSEISAEFQRKFEGVE